MSKKKPVLEVSLVMAGFQPGLPMAVIKPTGLANQRLLINVSGWKPGYSKAELRLAISPLTRRYGKLEDIIHAKDLIKLTHDRSTAPNIEKEQKVKVSYTAFHFLMTSGGKRYFIVPTEVVDVLSFGVKAYVPVNGGWLDVSPPDGKLRVPADVVKTIENFVEGK